MPAAAKDDDFGIGTWQLMQHQKTTAHQKRRTRSRRQGHSPSKDGKDSGERGRGRKALSRAYAKIAW